MDNKGYAVTREQRDWLYEEIMESLIRIKNKKIDNVVDEIGPYAPRQGELKRCFDALLVIKEDYDQTVKLWNNILLKGKSSLMEARVDEMKEAAKKAGIDDYKSPFESFESPFGDLTFGDLNSIFDSIDDYKQKKCEESKNKIKKDREDFERKFKSSF